MDRNGSKQIADVQDLSIQKRAEGVSSSALWFSRPWEDGAEVSPWWTPHRDNELFDFYLKPGNDILQGAVSSLTKKIKSMNWTITGPEEIIPYYQNLLMDAEFGQGWEFLLSKTLQDYLIRDKGVFWEIIGTGDIDGMLVNPVGLAYLDSRKCQLTGDVNYPVVFYNTKDGKPRRLHSSRVIHMVDMPSPNEDMLNIGFCGVSRVIASSSVLLKLARYKNEKLDDLPEAGLLILNNILPQKWDDAKASYQRERRKMGQHLWSNVMAFFSLDPAAQASADFISFSNLPDAFDEEQSINLYVNILSLAFGVDVREFWPMSAGPLGTAQETNIQHQKAKGKGIGDILSSLERAINWKVLPVSVSFTFDFQDDEEDLLRAEIEDTKTNTIMSMWKPDPVFPSPVSASEIRQMLADNVSYFKDSFLQEDETLEEIVGDNIKSIDRYGKITSKRRTRQKKGKYINRALEIATRNYQQGIISAEDIAEYALSMLIE